MTGDAGAEALKLRDKHLRASKKLEAGTGWRVTDDLTEDGRIVVATTETVTGHYLTASIADGRIRFAAAASPIRGAHLAFDEDEVSGQGDHIAARAAALTSGRALLVAAQSTWADFQDAVSTLRV